MRFTASRTSLRKLLAPGTVMGDVGKSADAELCPAAPCTPYGTSAPYQRALEATRDLWKIVRQEAALKDERNYQR